MVAALVLQIVALAFVVLLYLYLRGLATEEPAPVVPVPANDAEQPGRPAN